MRKDIKKQENIYSALNIFIASFSTSIFFYMYSLIVKNELLRKFFKNTHYGKREKSSMEKKLNNKKPRPYMAMQ